MKNRKKICFVVSALGTATAFLRDQIKLLSTDYDVYLVANNTSSSNRYLEGIKEIHNIPIYRNIDFKGDLKALSLLSSYLKENKFDVVHSITPKAGLLSAMAAKRAGVPNRIHTFTGQVWATRQGPIRTLLKMMDRIIASLNTKLLVDGEAQRQFLISEGVLRDSNSLVLGAGSICGANTERFTPSDEARRNARKELGLSDEKVVYTFMGRHNHEKGIYELLRAFDNLVSTRPNAFLLLIGSDEEGCLKDLSSYGNIKNDENFRYYGITHEPENILQASDVFCLPSYREGFGMSVVEAASLGIPAICSDIYGLKDTMVDGETGIRCKVKDSQSLQVAMEWMYDHPEDRKRMGVTARKRVLDLFSGEKIVGAWKDFYDELLAQ